MLGGLYEHGFDVPGTEHEVITDPEEVTRWRRFFLEHVPEVRAAIAALEKKGDSKREVENLKEYLESLERRSCTEERSVLVKFPVR